MVYNFKGQYFRVFEKGYFFLKKGEVFLIKFI